MSTKKQIVIPHNGPIYGKGSIMGPITTPFMEDVNTIATILIKGAAVHEVLESGVRVELDLLNYNKDNTPKPEPVQEAPKPQAQQNQQQNQQRHQNQQQGNKNQQQQQQAAKQEQKAQEAEAAQTNQRPVVEVDEGEKK